MSVYRVSVIIPAARMTHDEIIDASKSLGEISCTDASIRGHADSELLFARFADSLQAALSTAIADVKRAGYPVSKVELERIAISVCPILLKILAIILAAIMPGVTFGQAEQQDALQLIESERGGRHWVDEQTAPAKSPEESLQCLQIEPGFEIRLVAAEPLVRDPVAIAFDRYGRMFVAEYGDYPTGPPDGGEPLSRIVLLEDSDHDGQVDRRHVFADGLSFAHSLMPWNDGLLVGAQTEILFLTDTDGDHVADVRRVLFDGFTPAHAQMQIGCPQWGIDNWIWLNYGSGDVASSENPDARIRMPQRDFRFHPRSMQFEADTGMGQYGNTIDRWGHRFYCTNRSPIITTLLAAAALKRNPHAVITKTQYNVGKSGGETRVYPLVDMKSNHLSHAGTHTSACGVTAYHGDLLDAEHAESVFVCEPIGHLVTRSIVEPHGIRLTARRARRKADFLASTDTWFRPVSLANGPDGALYLADMYRLWVEHPKFLPPEVVLRLDWRAGEDRGRVYRIVPKGKRARPFRTPETTQQVVALLEDPNGWRQFLGQRLLVERQHNDAVPLLRQLLRHGDLPTTRLHALWTLDGLESLEVADVNHDLNDIYQHVRRDAVRLAGPLLHHESVHQKIVERAADDDPRVRFQVVLALGNTDRPEATRLLAALALRDGHDSWFTDGLLTSTKTRSGAIVFALIADGEFASNGDAAKSRLLRKLAEVVGARGDIDELNSLLHTLTASPTEGVWWQAAILSGLGTGLPRHQGALCPVTLSQLMTRPPDQLATLIAPLRRIFEHNRLTAQDRSRSVADRVAAVGLLTYQPFAEAAPALEALLAGDQPADVRTACISALSANGSPAAAEIVLRRWTELVPSIRGTALTMLLRRVESIRLLLNGMSQGHIETSVLSIDQRVLLLKHSDEGIRTLATKLLGGAVSENRRAVVQEYQDALSLPGSPESGAAVFRRTCAQCHIVDGYGYKAGPDISDVRNRSRPALLYDILDPNAKVEPRFTAYTVVATDGRTFNGLIASESTDAVVLQMAEGKQQVIGRSEIDEIRSSSVSLMPEGVEKDVSVQEMADLLEFLAKRSTRDN